MTRVTATRAPSAEPARGYQSYHRLGGELETLGEDTDDTTASLGLGLLTRSVAGRDRWG